MARSDKSTGLCSAHMYGDPKKECTVCYPVVLPLLVCNYLWSHLNAIFCERRCAEPIPDDLDEDIRERLLKLRELDEDIHSRTKFTPMERMAFQELADDDEAVALLHRITYDVDYDAHG